MPSFQQGRASAHTTDKCWWVFLVNKLYPGGYGSLFRQMGILQGGVYSNNRNKNDAKNSLEILSLLTPADSRRSINSVFVTYRCDGWLRSEENNFQYPL
jgi:hypothetical protein